MGELVRVGRGIVGQHDGPIGQLFRKQLNVSDAELARRRKAWKAPAPRYTRGVLAKYAELVSTASKGAVTD